VAVGRRAAVARDSGVGEWIAPAVVAAPAAAVGQRRVGERRATVERRRVGEWSAAVTRSVGDATGVGW